VKVLPPWFTGDVVNGVGTTVGFFLAAIVGRAIKEMRKKK